MLKALVQHLRKNKDKVVREVEVKVSNWDPTYGQLDDSIEKTDVVDFDKLLQEIDEFAETFQG